MSVEGMVDALRSAHRVVRPGGVVVDARPDASRIPRVIADGRVRARIVQSEEADHRDTESDRAIDVVKARGLLRSLGRGHLWHTSSVGSLRDLDEYLHDTGRYEWYERGGRARLRGRRGPFALRRAIKFEVLQRL